MATYLVTGGCGFIGSHLCDSLVAEQHTVRVLDDLSTGKLANVAPRVELIRGDVADPKLVAEAMDGVDGCFHLAAVASVERSIRDWVGTHRTNLSGTITIFDAACRTRPHAPIPVAYASSAAVYGHCSEVPLPEHAVCRPISAYGCDKLGCELHAFAAAKVHGLRSCGLRFFNVYGPRQDPSSPYSGVISIFCDRINAGQEITIFGDGSQTRDFIFVGDVVRALVKAIAVASTRAEVFNVCTGRDTSVLDLVHTISSLTGKQAVVNFAPPRTGDVRRSVGNPSEARAKLGFDARTSLQTGLQITCSSS